MKSVVICVCMILGTIANFIVLTGCGKENETSMAGIAISPVSPSTDTSAKSFLALGDSYTIGQSVALNDRFPAQATGLLRASVIKINDPDYIATTGWTTQNLINAIANINPKNNYDVVTLLIGVNDQYQRMDTAGYRLRFMQLLNTSVNLAGGRRTRVFVLSIPDYSVTPFVGQQYKPQVRAEIAWFNAINKEITLRYNIVYVDITPSSREAETNNSLVAGDGLHPSGLEYKKWAAMLAPHIKTVLE